MRGSFLLIMRYASICSGIEAASSAWHPLGWKPVFFSEIESFPSAVLKHHYPETPNYGDMTKHHEWPTHSIDVLVGGTPCQAFSLAGLRDGLNDPRGNLTLVYLGIIAKYQPTWVVWENVPGVLSSVSTDHPPEMEAPDDLVEGIERTLEEEYEADSSHAFACFLDGLSALGYGFAYRVLDAQFCRVDSHPGAVPQSRRRVFVVGHIGGQWQRAAAVLLEQGGLLGNPAPRRQSWKEVAPTISARAKGGGGLGTGFDLDGGLIQDVAPTIRAGASNGGAGHGARSGDSKDELIIPVSYTAGQFGEYKEGVGSLRSSGGDSGGGSETIVVEPSSYIPPIVPQAMSCKWEKGSSGPSGDEFANLVSYPESQDCIAIQDGRDIQKAQNGLGINDSGAAFTVDTTGAQAVAIPIGIDGSDVGFSLRASASHSGDKGDGGMNTTTVAVAFAENSRAEIRLEGGDGGRVGALSSGGGKPGQGTPCIATGMAVRRLTVRECERLMGFPDDYTLIPFRGKPACDGPRYKALGNSMAVNVMSWLGQRIEIVNQIKE